MNKYYYKTNICTFYIIPTRGGAELWVGDTTQEDSLGWYANATMAADDVFMCATGFDDWDDQLTVKDPMDLSFWTKLSQ